MGGGFEFGPLPLRPMRTVEYLDIPIEVRGMHTAVLLFLYDSLSETGAIQGGASWTDRQCFRQFGEGATRRKLYRLVEYNLARILGNDLVVEHYDCARVSGYLTKSENNRKAAKEQWAKRGLPTGSDSADPDGLEGPHPDAEREIRIRSGSDSEDPIRDPEEKKKIRKSPERERRSLGTTDEPVDHHVSSETEPEASKACLRHWEARYPDVEMSAADRAQLRKLIKAHPGEVVSIPRAYANYLGTVRSKADGHPARWFVKDFPNYLAAAKDNRPGNGHAVGQAPPASSIVVGVNTL